MEKREGKRENAPAAFNTIPIWLGPVGKKKVGRAPEGKKIQEKKVRNGGALVE